MDDSLDLKRIRQAERQARLEAAERNYEVCAGVVLRLGYVLTNQTLGQWLISDERRVVVQYWPSAQKWQVTRGGTVHHGTFLDLCQFLEREWL